jgi:hypothetical protein
LAVDQADQKASGTVLSPGPRTTVELATFRVRERQIGIAGHLVRQHHVN